jgi:signal peptidase I
MLPTFQDHGVNFINRLAYSRSEPQRGDVVGIRLAGTSVMLLKRIVGLPGEAVAFHRGRLFINGTELNEPYMDFENYPCDWEMLPKTNGPSEFYFVGDNRTMAQANHYEGQADRERIIGRIVLCKNWFASSPSRP